MCADVLEQVFCPDTLLLLLLTLMAFVLPLCPVLPCPTRATKHLSGLFLGAA